MTLDALDELVGKRVDLAGDAERAVAQVAARASGNLAKLAGVEIAILIAVEFPVLREGDVVDVEVQPHADRIGGDQVVDVAGLVERDLGISGAWRKGAQHHGCAAALAADQLGDGIDFVGREGDDCRATRQARQLLGARIGQVGEARAGDDGDALEQPLDDAAHRGGAQQQRLLPAAQMQQPVGEDVAALEIARQLHLVDGDEGDIRLARHRLHSADGIARAGRYDLFLAGDEGDLVRADLLADTRIDLACKQPQWQADHAALMRNHALDGEMRLAGVGRTQNGRDVTTRKDQRF